MTETVRLTIEKMVAGGEGLARHEGCVVFVPNVLPGEEILAEITEAKKDFARARLIETIVPSPDRTEPPCPLAGTCGGCDWLHIDPAAQARLKIDIVRDALKRMGGLEWPDLRIETGSPLGYRNRIQVHTSGSTGPESVGFLERGGHGFVPVAACPVAHPTLQSIFKEGAKVGGPARFLAFGHSHAVGGAAGSAPRASLAREDENPDAEIEVSLLGRMVRFPLRGFFQSNLEMLEKLIPFALEGLSGDVALDLYAGVGLFGTFLREHFNRVVCVEFNTHAQRFARANVGDEKGVFLAEALEKVVRMPGNPLAQERAQAAVIDPPREGLDASVRKWLRENPVQNLVYVSCNPVTLARDLKDLLAGPYSLEDIRLFDFYPQTSHIEAVAKLGLKPA